MNILPKKRWHVRTKDNIARVRKDEAQAALDEEARLKRAALAEQEARTTLLRSKVAAGTDRSTAQPSSTCENKLPMDEDSSGHVNFFADLERQERTFGLNKDHETEKRNEKEAEEKRIGLLKYLGEGSSEYTKEIPWYQKVPKRPDPAEERRVIMQISSSGTASSPLKNALKRLLPKSDEMSKISDRKHAKKRKKHEKRANEISDESSTTTSSSDDEATGKKSGSSNLSQLRQERLRRENAEKLRTDELLRKMKRKSCEESLHSKKLPFEQKYSSQFNPNIARQNK